MKKKTLIKVVSIVAICIAITIALTFAINTGFKHDEPLVYVTRTGEKYHSGGCGYLWASSIPRGLNEAKKAGYTACSRCGGKPSGTITINNYGAAFGISSLIMCAVVLLGFIVYNKVNASCEEPKNKYSFPSRKDTPTLYTQNIKPNIIPTNAIIDPKPSIVVKCGDIVIHKSFGRGKVVKLSQNYITVQFLDKAREFVFPSAFIEGFLKKENMF